jgi:hypothetical protein
MKKRVPKRGTSIVHLSYAHTFPTDRSVDNGARILRARNLCRAADSETNAIVSKKGGRRAGVDAQVKVDICPVLVGSCEAVLRAEGIALDGAEVVDCWERGKLVLVGGDGKILEDESEGEMPCSCVRER